MKRPLTTAILALLAAFWALDLNAYGQDEVTPEEELEAKMEEIDVTDPDQLFEVALWAKAHKKSSKVRKEGRRLLREIIELDEDHEGARKELGFVYFNDKWMSKKQKEKAEKKLRQKEMKEKGFIYFKKGWIKKADRRQWNNRWEKNDDGIWMSYEDVQRAKGYTFFKGAWLRLSDDDRKSMEHHRKMTGDDVLVVTTEHFVLHLDVPAKFAAKYQELVEQVYDWYVETFKVPAPQRDMLFGGRRCHIWSFETAQQFQDWITTYAEEYDLDDDDKKQLRQRPSGYLISHKRLITTIAKKAEDKENPMIHHIGSMLVFWHTGNRHAPWLSEAMGHLVEHEHSSEKYGHTNCTTNSRYGGQGGVAQKQFNTKDSRPRTKSVVKAGDDRAVRELSMLGLNSLNGDDLAQGFSMTEWMYHEKLDNMIRFLKSLRDFRVPKDIQGNDEKRRAACIEAGIKGGFEGMSLDEFDQNWRKYVKKNYK